jgi:hypothetical protein
LLGHQTVYVHYPIAFAGGLYFNPTEGFAYATEITSALEEQKLIGGDGLGESATRSAALI